MLSGKRVLTRAEIFPHLCLIKGEALLAVVLNHLLLLKLSVAFSGNIGSRKIVPGRNGVDAIT